MKSLNSCRILKWITGLTVIWAASGCGEVSTSSVLSDAEQKYFFVNGKCVDSEGNEGLNPTQIPVGSVTHGDDVESDDPFFQCRDFRNLTQSAYWAIDFSYLDLRGSDFSGSSFLYSSFFGSDLRGTKFTRMRRSFDFADLTNVRVPTDARSVSFRYANLNSSSFPGSPHRTGFDFMGAFFHNAEMGGLTSDDNLNGAVFNDATSIPFSQSEAIERGMIHSDLSKGEPYRKRYHSRLIQYVRTQFCRNCTPVIKTTRFVNGSGLISEEAKRNLDERSRHTVCEAGGDGPPFPSRKVSCSFFNLCTQLNDDGSIGSCQQ